VLYETFHINSTAMSSIFSGIRSAFSRYQWVIITLLVLGGAFFYYFTVILYKNESRIKQRSFRGLSLMAENIEKDISLTSEKNTLNFLRGMINAKDSVARVKISKAYNLERKSKNITDSNGKFLPGPIFITTGTRPQLNFEVKYNGKTDTISADAISFLNTLLRKDLFSRYLVIADSDVIYENIQGTFDHSLKDSLKERNALNNGNLLQISVEGESYHMFSLPFTVQGKEWWIAGLMLSDEYKVEKMQLSGDIIAFTIFIFFICLLSFPFLKCFLMNKEEHLNSRDVVFAFFSFYLIAAVMTIAVWDLYSYRSLYTKGKDIQLTKLTCQLDSSLRKEIKQVIDQLKVASESDLNDDLYNIRDSLAKQLKGEIAGDINLTKLITYPFIQNIVWIDSSGMQQIRWTTNSYSPQKINVKERPYFQKAYRNDLWPDDRGNSFHFGVIRSWLADSVLGVVSMKSNKKKMIRSREVQLPVMALTSRFQSVFDPILPQGFGFAILNEDGKVYFHSNKEYDLYEDIIKETGNNVLLRSSLDTRMAQFFTAYYYGVSCRFYIKPLKDMPLFVVAYSPDGSVGENNTSLLSALTVFIFMQAFLIFLSAILIQAFRLKVSKSGLKTYSLSWITPKKDHQRSYLQHIWLYALMTLIEMFFSKPIELYFNNKFNDTLFTPGIIFTFSILSVGFSYYLIRVKLPDKHTQERKTSRWFPLLGISILYAFVLFIFTQNMFRQTPSLGINFLVIQMAAFFLIIYIRKIADTGNKIVRAIMLFFRKTSTKLFTKQFTLAEDISYRNAYIFSLLMFIFLNSIISSHKLFQLGYDQESLLMLKSQQMHFAKSLWAKNDGTIIANDSLIGRYYKNIIADNITFPAKNFNLKIDRNITAKKFPWLYRQIRPSYKDFSRSMETFNSNFSDDTVYQWKAERSNLKLYAQNNNAGLEKNKLNRLLIYTPFKPLRLPGKNYVPGMKQKEGVHAFVILFYLLNILILLGLYLLVREFLKRVLFPSVTKENIDQVPLLKEILLTNEHHIMIVGLPDSGKSHKVQEIFEKYTVTITDAEIIPDTHDIKTFCAEIHMTSPDKMITEIENFKAQVSKIKTKDKHNTMCFLLVRNFEYCFHDKAITKQKLEALELLLKEKNFKIILFSTTQNLPFVEEYFETIKNETGTASEEATLNAERWTNVMNNFPIFYFRWQNNERPPNRSQPDYFIKQETRNSDFLYDLRSRIQYDYNHKLARTGSASLAEDEMEVKISQMASNYFDSIWMSLSMTERKVLYDLAKDQLVNHNNLHDLSILYQKGLIIYAEYEDQLMLMSRSFRNYILTRLNKDEINKLQANEAEKGNWHKLRTILIVIILLVGIFLFTTQQEALNGLVAYLSAFSGGIFALLNIINKIPAGGK